MSDQQPGVRVLWYPLYSNVRKLLPVLEGLSKKEVHEMRQAVVSRQGTPENPVSWSDPDSWIGNLLKGRQASLAKRIWKETDGGVNPRYLHGEIQFIELYELLSEDEDGCYRLTDEGRAFLAHEPSLETSIDQQEGLLFILSLLETRESGKRADLLPEWRKHLRAVDSPYHSANTEQHTLRHRLANLVDRGLLTREGVTYRITDKALDPIAVPEDHVQDPSRELRQKVRRLNNEMKAKMAKRLGKMHPARFESLVGELLEAMGYEDVEVTKESGDKGVDVVAKHKFGITTVTEVVQVKRHKGSIGRPVLDQLRGALPYHDAIQGTIITLGKFSKGCIDAALFRGAAPITLIDGKKLIELLVDHGIGVKTQEIELLQIDESFFAGEEDGEE